VYIVHVTYGPPAFPRVIVNENYSVRTFPISS
jgi:hypothetical protein